MRFILSLATVSALAAAAVRADEEDTPTSYLDLSDPYNKIVVAHLVFMILTFLVLVPAAILIARFGRTYFKWYPHHRNIQLASIVFLIVGFFLGISAAYPAPVGKETHYQLGVAVFVLFFVQVALGLGAHKLLNKKGTRAMGFVHAPLGLLIFGLAFWNMQIGWNVWGGGYEAPAAPRDVLYAWLGLLVLLYLIGLTFIPREIKQSRQQKEVGEKDVEPLSSTTASSRTNHMVSVDSSRA